MAVIQDESDAFIPPKNRGRWRQIGFLVVAAGMVVGVVRLLPHAQAYLAPLSEESAVDSPSEVLGGNKSDELPDLRSTRKLLSRSLPRYLDEFRRYRRFLKRHEGDADGSELERARVALERELGMTPDLAPILQPLLEVAPTELETQRANVERILGQLIQWLESRRLPFQARFSFVTEDSLLVIQPRFYERVGERTFRIGSENILIRYLDRLNLLELDRVKEPQESLPALPEVSTRMESAVLQRRTLASLAPDGVFALLPGLASPGIWSDTEKKLASLVADEWWQAMAGQVPPDATRALESLSCNLLTRNQVYRAVNHRAGGRWMMVEPHSIRFGWSDRLRLEIMEQYAARDMVRLRYEDIVLLRRYDLEAGSMARDAKPALHFLLLHQFELAGLGQAARIWLEPRPFEVPLSLDSAVGSAASRLVMSIAGARLIRLSESSQCMSEVGALIADAFLPTKASTEAARFVLPLMTGFSIEQWPPDDAQLQLIIASFDRRRCDEISAKSRAGFASLFGEYPSIDVQSEILGAPSSVR